MRLDGAAADQSIDLLAACVDPASELQSDLLITTLIEAFEQGGTAKLISADIIRKTNQSVELILIERDLDQFAHRANRRACILLEQSRSLRLRETGGKTRVFAGPDQVTVTNGGMTGDVGVDLAPKAFKVANQIETLAVELFRPALTRR